MQNIDVNLLIPHPNNPRKELGDISELADSIKAQGVLQNLTVVDNGDITYTVIIGHRRLAAAKKAGIEMVPCTVVKMDKATQASTMLLENMQRVDLTPYEQAQGFQMCLDLGMSENTLKEKTGFSKTTIKHRLKLLKLDQEKFKKGIERGATLQDYIDLEQIEDLEVKGEVLDVIGTKDYRYKLNNELSIQKSINKAKEYSKKLKAVMEQVDEKPEGYTRCSFLYSGCYGGYELPNDLDERKYVFVLYNRDSIEIYKEILESDEIFQTKKDEPKILTKEELDVIEIKKKAEAAYQTRLEFAKSIYRSSVKDTDVEFEIKYAFDMIVGSIKNNGYDDTEIFEQVTGKELENIKATKIGEMLSKLSSHYLFALIYSNLDNTSDDVTICTWSYNGQYGKYRDNNKDEITILYSFLDHYGYQPSEEEKAIMFGTHELYLKEE